jgi:hypothetical protein
VGREGDPCHGDVHVESLLPEELLFWGHIFIVCLWLWKIERCLSTDVRL